MNALEADENRHLYKTINIDCDVGGYINIENISRI